MTDFDPGYGAEPWATLVRECPAEDVFRPSDFRVEWGPIFHRGRLDGSARILVIGQDPGAHEAASRRILVGEAGQRLQGFLARLGIQRSYVMINAFTYSVYGQWAGVRNRWNPEIAAYRNRWLDALLVGSQVEAVISLGSLAQSAFEQWRATPAGQASGLECRRVYHPTYPEGASQGNPTTLAAATARLVRDWNRALEDLGGRLSATDAPPLGPFGDDPMADVVPIPAEDLPAGMPAWMRSTETWAWRSGETSEEKRATLVVQVPEAERPWRDD
jgi:uracil-DNA glycosylase family 4